MRIRHLLKISKTKACGNKSFSSPSTAIFENLMFQCYWRFCGYDNTATKIQFFVRVFRKFPTAYKAYGPLWVTNIFRKLCKFDCKLIVLTHLRLALPTVSSQNCFVLLRINLFLEALSTTCRKIPGPRESPATQRISISITINYD